MDIEDVENGLRNAKFLHLVDDVLISYRDNLLDAIARKQVDAHLELCLLCERRLEFFQQERDALDNLNGFCLGVDAPAGARQQFADYLREAVSNWKAYFAQRKLVRGGPESGVEFWRWQSKNQVFNISAIRESNLDITLRISTSDAQLAGCRVKVMMGRFTGEATMQPFREPEIRAEARIPRNKRPRDMSDLSIERLD